MATGNKLTPSADTYIGIEFSRGIAALMVLTAHYSIFISRDKSLLNFLSTGVDLFFVISGFVFARLILGDKNIKVRSFFIKRLFRIYPLYFIAVFVYYYFSVPSENGLLYLVKHLLFLHTTSSKAEAFFLNPPFWSLPVEMEYYMFIPLLAYLCRFNRILPVLFIFSFMLRLVLIIKTGPVGESNIYSVLARHLTGILPEFLIGIFLYQYAVLNKKNKSIKVLYISAIAGIVIIGSLAYFSVVYGAGRISGLFNMLCALGYALLLAPIVMVNQDRFTGKIKSTFVFVGSISYGVYLFHNAVPKALSSVGIEISGYLAFGLCALLTVGVSVVLNRYVEEPLRLYGRRLARRYENSSLGAVVISEARS